MSHYPRNDEDVWWDDKRVFVKKGSDAHEAIEALRRPGETWKAALERYAELCLEQQRINPGGWQAAVHRILRDAIARKRRAA